jgi:putative membrane protein
MADEQPETIRRKGELDPDKVESEILANERTFLAWVRTSIALMTFGFVIARFSLWLREMSFGINAAATVAVPHTGISAVIGECIMGVGGALTAFAAWRYHVVHRSILRGEIEPDLRMVAAITAIILAATAAMIVYVTVLSRAI